MMHRTRVSPTKGSSAMLSGAAILNYLPKGVMLQSCKKIPKETPKHGHQSKTQINVSMVAIRMRVYLSYTDIQKKK